MNIVTDNSELEKLVIKLIKKHDKISFAVAWASSKTKVFKALLANKSKVSSSTIGTHFYQTDPEVLNEFVGDESVKFVLQPSGVFHPKVYYFESDNSWDLIVGSANMTHGAFTKNNEFNIHIRSNECLKEEVKVDSLRQIVSYYSMGREMSTEEYQAYKIIWQKQQPKLRKLSGIYGAEIPNASPVTSQIFTLDWPQYYLKVCNEPFDAIDERVALLDTIRDGFNNYSSFAEMPLGLRKTIAGLPTDYNEYWAWFGSMRGAGVYHSKVNNNEVNLSKALDCIPLYGPVTRTQYDGFISYYLSAFPEGRSGIATATRLLAMKRPDFFVCVDSKNRDGICRDFGISVSSLSYERYWVELLSRIHDSTWFDSEQPTDAKQKAIWERRVAFLDCIFYEE